MMKMRWMLLFLVFLLNLSGLAAVYAESLSESRLQQQRDWFSQAQQALDNEQMDEFHSLLKQLEDYPLSYYLRYLYLKSHLHLVLPSEMEAFFKAYPTSVLTNKLRYDWLTQLAREERWEQFIADYHPQVKNTALECQYLSARLQRGDTAPELLQEARKLWAVGNSQPKVCDAVFDYLFAQGMDDDLLWQRLHLAMLNGKVPLATYLAKKLSDETRQKQFAVWQKVQAKPLASLETFAEADSDFTQEIIQQAIVRLARKDLDNAQRLWADLSGKYAFSVGKKAVIERELALRAALAKQSTSLEQLKALQHDSQWDETIRQMFLQNALIARDWESIINIIQRFPNEAQDEPQWRYWEARALEQTGKEVLAKTLYQDLAKERDFYGFLAAEKVGQAYAMNNRKIDLTAEQIKQLYQQHPAIERAREFYHLGMKTEATREWHNELLYMNQAQMVQAAALARQWHWYNWAIVTAAKAGFYDDLDMRFPLAYYAELQAGTQEQELDMAWAYGITRQESAFMHDATSPAGAMGLMQLMPATARAMAEAIGLLIENKQEIYDTYTNVRLGTAYLKRMLNNFDGNYMLATAAYNAGPGRAVRWSRDFACQPADIWVEQIPFRETRLYVQRVLSYTVIFDAKLGNQNKGLRLRDVGGENCS